MSTHKIVARADSLGLAACLVWAALAVPAEAQIPLVPKDQPNNQAIACEEFENPATPIARLRDLYLSGDWLKLVADTKTMLEKCSFKPESDDPFLFTSDPSAARKPNFQRDWYSVVLATVDTNDEPLILRYLIHDPVPYPFSSTVLDIPAARRDEKKKKSDTDEHTPRLIQVFLAPSTALSLQSRIEATETSNPLVEQIADVVKAVIDPTVVLPLLKGILPPSAGALAPSTPPKSPLRASVARIFPPFARGDYKYSDTLRAAPVLDTDSNLLLRSKFDGLVEAAKKAAAAAAKESKEEFAKLSTEAALAERLSQSAAGYLKGTGTTNCAAATYKSSCWDDLEQVLEQGRRNFCLAQDTQQYCQSERDELTLLRFKQTAEPPKTVVTTAKSSVSVLPRQRYSFGVVSAYIVHASTSSDRVKVDGGKLTADPIGRALNTVVLNIHPRFNPKAPVMEKGEKWRAFLGGVITPNIGLAVGGGYGFLKNLSVNGGYALLWIPTLRDDDVLGEAPTNGTEPFKSGVAHAWFAGLGYKFGK